MKTVREGKDHAGEQASLMIVKKLTPNVFGLAYQLRIKRALACGEWDTCLVSHLTQQLACRLAHLPLGCLVVQKIQAPHQLLDCNAHTTINESWPSQAPDQVGIARGVPKSCF